MEQKLSSDLWNRQIFNSPETSFAQPFLGNVLRESVMYGAGKAFVDVKIMLNINYFLKKHKKMH
jgi:hypothetical protein